MGSSSKVLLVGATSLIVGVYAISLKNVQTTGMQTAQSQVNRMQNERLVDAALIIALNKVKSTSGLTEVTDAHANVMGGEVTYSVILPSSHWDLGDKATINLTITKGDMTKIVVASVQRLSSSHGHGRGFDTHKKGYRKLHRGDWQLTNTFVKRG